MSFMNEEANKHEAEKYVKIAAKAAANGDVDKAERMLTIAENIYSTPLGRKILHDIQSSRVERHDIQNVRIERRPSKQSFGSESSSGSCVCSSSEECRKSPNESVSSEDDYEYTGNVLQTAYHHQRHPINIRNFDDAYMSLDKADEYFAMAQQELTKKSKSENKPKLEEYGFENPSTPAVEVNDEKTKVKKKHHHSQRKEKDKSLKAKH